MEHTIEFMFSGAPVKVFIQPKAVVVKFVGQRFQFTALQAALRERVRAEVNKAGFGAHLGKILTGKLKRSR